MERDKEINSKSDSMEWETWRQGSHIYCAGWEQILALC